MKKLITIILLLALIAPAVSMADDTISGKWSFFWDRRNMNDDILLINMDLIILSNNASFLIISRVKRGEKTFYTEEPTAVGTCMPDDDGGYTLYINNAFPPVQYPIELDDEGRLLLKFDDNVVYPFIRTQSYEGVTP
jgi:hypothetical protein